MDTLKYNLVSDSMGKSAASEDPSAPNSDTTQAVPKWAKYVCFGFVEQVPEEVKFVPGQLCFCRGFMHEPHATHGN